MVKSHNTKPLNLTEVENYKNTVTRTLEKNCTTQTSLILAESDPDKLATCQYSFENLFDLYKETKTALMRIFPVSTPTTNQSSYISKSRQQFERLLPLQMQKPKPNHFFKCQRNSSRPSHCSWMFRRHIIRLGLKNQTCNAEFIRLL